MTLAEFIATAQNAIDHGQDPDVPICAWDPDIEEWHVVTKLVLSGRQVLIYTDED